VEILDIIGHEDLDILASMSEGLKKSGTTVVATNGCFDVLHAGHAALFSDIVKMSGQSNPFIIVLLNSDSSVKFLKGEGRPIFNELDRAMLVASFKNVGYVHIFDGIRCDKELAAIRPSIYIKGGDYTRDKLDPFEREALDKCGARIRFVPFRMGRSTISLAKRLWL
jgi:rfaE bifunctional protein nucleotidyltransferase chain/domain